jgi:threonine/homoserine/homoserine lactone efflux protein
MPEPAALLAFIVASVVLIALPGPNLVYILTRSVSHGRRAGIVSALGVEAGTLVHVTAAALGVSTVVTTVPVIRPALAWAGAAYLAWLALQTLRSPAQPTTIEASARRTFFAGLLVNLLNPKVTLFFLAFLPRFVGPGADLTTARLQMLTFGAVFFALALVVDLFYALAGAELSERLTARPGLLSAQRYTVVTVYIGLAGYAVLS